MEKISSEPIDSGTTPISNQEARANKVSDLSQEDAFPQDFDAGLSPETSKKIISASVDEAR
jgi:hypothetical protein